MSLSVILETFGWKSAQVISKQLLEDGLLMMHFCYFHQNMTLKNYLNKQHKSIKFTSKIEKNGLLLFLDIKSSRDNNKFVTSDYHNPTFSGAFTNFESFIPDIHKRRLMEALLHRSLCQKVFE